MKTKKLIELLMAEDPSGEAECCIGNSDIHFVEIAPAWYDGRLEVLIRDENNPYYNIIGGKITSKGMKVFIRSLSLEDVLLDDPESPIDLSECQDNGGRYAKYIEKCREDGRELNKKIEENKNVVDSTK
jgi:hypothetical protein